MNLVAVAHRGQYISGDSVKRQTIVGGVGVQQRSLFGDMTRVSSIVLFAGGGGSCTGIEQATGQSPLAAVNHCASALRIHALNHPTTHHEREDVFQANPFLLARGRSLDLLWASPDCTHHSKARGSKPRDSGRRALASVVVDWASTLRPPPGLIMLENVTEFLQWGPVDDRGKPIRSQAGEGFGAWAQSLIDLGYRLEWRILNAADYGVPTIRTRLYLIARCDGNPIVWPSPTHGPGQSKPWASAAECIDLTSIGALATTDRLKAKTWARIDDGLSRLNDPGFSHDHAGAGHSSSSTMARANPDRSTCHCLSRQLTTGLDWSPSPTMASTSGC